MPKAIWNNQITAEVPLTEIHRVEGNIYFPPAAVKREFLQPSDSHTHYSMKGKASCYKVVVGGKINEDAAWYYAELSAIAARRRCRLLERRPSRGLT